MFRQGPSAAQSAFEGTRPIEKDLFKIAPRLIAEILGDEISAGGLVKQMGIDHEWLELRNDNYSIARFGESLIALFTTRSQPPSPTKAAIIVAASKNGKA